MKPRMMFLLLVACCGHVELRADESPQALRESRRPLITVSKETTYITEPLTEDGEVDYFAAYDQYMRDADTHKIR